MALSMSVSAGAHNARHNTDLDYRANLRNVDADLSVGNISIRDVPIAEAYETVFGDSLRAYNAKQKSKGHPERCIGDYLSKIEKAYSDDSARVKSGNKGRVNVPKPCYEYVLQIGNRDTFGGELDNGKAEEIFRETADSIRSKTEGAGKGRSRTRHRAKAHGLRPQASRRAGVPAGDARLQRADGQNRAEAQPRRGA